MNTLPAPEDGIVYLVGNGRDKPKRGKKNPLTQKGRKSQHKPWFVGIRFALLIVNWETYRLPAAFRLIRPKTHPEYQKENELFREIVTQFNPPSWAKTMVVEGDAAYGSQENMKRVMQRDAEDSDRQWGYVFAIARTWKTVDDKAIKDLVTPLPRKHDKRTWVPRLPGSPGRKTFWIYS